MSTLLYISLTTPAMLLGGVLVALPIVAHLMFRKARRRVTFPTIRLLAEATAAQSSVFYLRRLIVLTLRCLAVMLLAWAFARPMWVDAGSPDADAGADVVVVLDVSASSDLRIGGIRVIERVRSEAMGVLDDLTAGRDRATLIYAGRTPRADYPDTIPNLEALRADVAAMRPTQERADLSAAIAMGVAILADCEGVRRLVVISDMQRTNWADVKIDAKRSSELRIATRIIAAGAGEAANVSLIEPRITPARPAVGLPATASVTVANHTPAERAITVRAALNGRSVGSQRISVDPGAMGVAAFPVTFESTAQHRIVFDTDPDDLPADDEAFLVADAVDRVSVVVIGDDDPARPTGAGFFIVRALAPRGDASDRITVRHVRGAEVTAEAIAGAEVIVLGDAARLSEASAAALRGAIAEGTGAIFFACGGAARANMQALADAAGGQPLTPWRVGALREPAARGEAARLGEGQFDSPPLDAFDDPARSALGRIDFLRYHAVDAVNADARIVLRFADADRTPALAVSEHGRGRLAAANFGPGPVQSDLGRRALFVPLLHAMVDHVRPRREDAGRLISVGTPVSWSVDAPRTARLEVVAPDGRPMGVQIDRQGDRAMVRLSATSAGVYTLRRDGQAVQMTAVNVDPREGEVARIDPALLAERFGDGAAVETTDAAGRTATRAGGDPLWMWFVIAALAVMATEMLLVGVYRR